MTLTLDQARARAPGVSPAPVGLFATDHGYPFKITVRCKHCQGDDVRRDAYAAWDTDSQKWLIDSVYDHGFCNDCEGESSLVERFTDDTGADLGPVGRWCCYDGETYTGPEGEK